MNFDSISDFISFVNDTKKYEGALAALKTQQEAIITPVAFVLSGISSATASANSVIITPVRAVRLNVSASTGSVYMNVIQGLR